MRTPRAYLLSLFTLVAAACGTSPSGESPLFTRVPPEASGITFVNRIVEDEGFNVLEYEYFYNGGGVAVGDVDGNGLPDLYFTANAGPNRLYLNRGGFVFEDATERAGLLGTSATWDTGVTMADVNGDGHLDLYVCRSGRVSEARRRNALYLNNGDGTFTERAAAYGLDDPAYSTHATFFDYDRDGDLDLYLLNHPIRRLTRFDVGLVRRQRDPLAGDKLYRNDGDRFTDVSEAAGIIGNPIGFGLSVTASDFDGDGWIDLYVANDYVEDDYFYRNNGDGTFTEAFRQAFAHASYSSMGADAADIDNDGRPDLFTLDMLPPDHRRRMLLKGPDDHAMFTRLRGYGYAPQYMRNMLHRNRGDDTFAEIGRLAGVEATDWSWAALLADFDLDGFKDLFVTNGYLRDYTNLDFLNVTLREAYRTAQAEGKKLHAYELVQHMPTSELVNYAFRNEGTLRFSDRTRAWGLDEAAYSNGAAYADLDGDGDLDLVVNNINGPAFVYENHAAGRSGRHFLKVRLDGPPGNRFGTGAKVTLTTPDGQTLFQEMMPVRGYQSSVEPVLVFGLGAATSVALEVVWPDGRRERRDGVAADQTITLAHADAGDATPPPAPPAPAPLFAYLPDGRGLAFTHREDAFIDFEREPLLPHMPSRLGPALARADVNRDGLPDVFVGGAKGQAARLFLQQLDGTFRPASVPALDDDAAFEDVAALFFDADGDGDADLYVVSGGYDVPTDAPAYQDRLYRNNGFGAFERAFDALPPMPVSGGAVAAHDVDGDGDTDLFVGGRVLAGRYPLAPRSYLLLNDGAGRFTDATNRLAPALRTPGMVTAAVWVDLDGDGVKELVLAGEWMPLRVFRTAPGPVLVEATDAAGLAGTDGWWNTLAAADLDGDGDADLVAGNRGLNGPLRVAPRTPAFILGGDLDRNGFVDPLIGHYLDGRPYPVATRDELLAQVPAFAERFPTYAAYAEATFDEVVPPREREGMPLLYARMAETTVFENRGDGTFHPRPLPVEAQLAPVNAILPADLDGDGVMDLLLAGNHLNVRAQWGAEDASRGLFLRGRGDGTFTPVPGTESGFLVPGEVRGLVGVGTRAAPLVVAARNDGPLAVFALLPPRPPS